MTSSSQVTRERNHRRTVTYDSYKRSDGLWDIEVCVQDSKAYEYFDLERGKLDPGHLLHNIAACVTIDNDMQVHAITGDMRDVPYSFCKLSTANLQGLVGASLGKGWRQALNENLGRTQGCTHMREMLFGVATVAFQTIAGESNRPENKDMEMVTHGDKPYFIGACHSLAFDSPVIATFFPEFAPKED